MEVDGPQRSRELNVVPADQQVKTGMLFEHARQLDPTWIPGPGQKYVDGPKQTMQVSAVRRGVVYYRTPDAKAGQFSADLADMTEGGDVVGRWLTCWECRHSLVGHMTDGGCTSGRYARWLYHPCECRRDKDGVDRRRPPAPMTKHAGWCASFDLEPCDCGFDQPPT